MDNKLRADISQWLANMGISNQYSEGFPTLVMVLACFLVAFVAYLIVRRGVLHAVNLMIRRTKNSWDDSFMEFKVMEKVALLVPALVLNLLLPIVLRAHPFISDVLDRLLSVLIVVLFIRATFAALDATLQIAQKNQLSRRMPIKSFVQLIKLFLFCIGLIVCISILANQSPVYFLSGLGVATGLVMLVFRDTILGFVAGIQLAANRMVSPGDWIQMDKYGANGAIEDISLTTVKVRNFDNTLTMLPAYVLVQDAFKNWQGMAESGGRRICRAINLDINSIRFLTPDEINKLKQIDLLKDYLETKEQELVNLNQQIANSKNPANGRYLTNAGTFRAYVLAYLKNSDKTRKDMTVLVRQLEPSELGLPIQLYVFTNDTRWAFYEDIQADIFDHLFSILSEFGLKAFQNPSGKDVQSLAADSSH